MNRSLSYFKAIIILFIYTFASALLASGLLFVVKKFFMASSNIDSQWQNYMYVMIQTITIFGLPVLLFHTINEKVKIRILPQKGFLKIFAIGAVAWILCYFPVNALWEINKSILFPEFMSGIEQTLKSLQDQSDVFINEFMKYRGSIHLLMLIIVVGLIPAVFEELFFRGLIQQFVFKMFGTAWSSIIITSIIFSVFHFEFYALLPRILLGVLLGVAFHSTGKLWLPAALHFINNLASILFHQFLQKQQLDALSEIGIGNFQWLISLSSAILLFYVLKVMLKGQFSR